MEEPLLRRRDRTPTITVRGDIDETLQPPDVSVEVQKALAPIMAKLPAGYQIEMAGPIEESAKANAALALVFPVMLTALAAVLVARFNQIEGYRCLSLIRALAVVKCQSALAWFALRSCSQAATSSMRSCLSGMRRSRHWDDRTPSSDSARSSQLPCFGV